MTDLVVDPSKVPVEARQALPDIIRRYAEGEPIPELAAEMGVHRATLYRWMLAGTGDKQYSDLVTHCLVRRVADADQKLEEARDPCDIARARETAKFARMDLERRRPSLYGARQPEQSQPIQILIQNYSSE